MLMQGGQAFMPDCPPVRISTLCQVNVLSRGCKFGMQAFKTGDTYFAFLKGGSTCVSTQNGQRV